MAARGRSRPRTKARGSNYSPEVEAWFADLEHPQKETMLAVREVILAADPRVSECVKWSTPTFVFEGNIASFQPKAKRFASLMFHRGSEIPGSYPSLKGSGRLVRTMQFASPSEVEGHKAELTAVVRAWCASRSD